MIDASQHESERAEPGALAPAGYPPAPWRLRGWAVMTLQAVDLAAARRAAPPELRPVAVWPGRALGGLYLASYEAGSALTYHELVVVAAFARSGGGNGGFARRRGRIGAWIPLIYVDDERSLAGGHAIWALPKQLARFEVEQRGTRRLVRVTQDATVLCEIAYEPRTPAIAPPFPLPLPGFGTTGGAARYFVGRMRGRIAAARASVNVPSASPLASYGLDRPRLTMAWRSLDVTVPAPAI